MYIDVSQKVAGHLRWLYQLPWIGYILKLLALIFRLPIRFAQLNKDILLLRQRIENLELISRCYNDNYQDLHKVVLDQRRIINDMITKKDANEKVGVVSVPKPHLDKFYIDFEDRFRGSQDHISHILNTRYLKRVVSKAASGEVLDLGCGRGEWLRLLSASGIKGRGVDLNQAMINEAAKYISDVMHCDALEYLHKCEANTFSVVTSFHLIEHLSFEQQIAFIDDILRVLKPGGLMFLETPNPENLRVGSCNFYTDPTHRNPLPPDTLLFMVQQRGFKPVEVERFGRSLPLSDSQNSDLKLLFDWAGVEQDYAIIGTKPILNISL